MSEDFLHKIDLKVLQKETEIDSAEDIGRFLQMKNPKGVYNWAKDKDIHGTRPSFNDVIRLLKKGATVETLFGVEYKGPIKPPVLGGPLPPEIANDPDFIAGQNQAFKDIEAKIEARVLAKLKERGLAPIPPGSDNVHIDLQDPKFQELVEKALLRIEERRKLNEKGVI